MAATAIIRCPVCLTSQVFPVETPDDKAIHCGNCNQSFSFSDSLSADAMDGLSVDPDAAAKTPNVIDVPVTTTTEFTVEPDEQKGHPLLVWFIGLVVCAPAVWFVRDMVREMKGPDFLQLYLFIFIGLWLLVVFVRKGLKGNPHVTFVGLFVYEAIGYFRYVDASAAGMHKFLYLFMMMGFGAVVLFLKAEYFENTGGGGSSSDCSSFSSCSSCSGCGGGGGCGGCG